MEDNRNTAGNENRTQPDQHRTDVQQIARKMGVSEEEVRKAIQQVGTVREKIEAWISDRNNAKE